MSVASSLGTGYGVTNTFIRGVSRPLLSPVVLWHENGFDKLVQFVQVDIAENGAAHASYNGAKKVLAFVYQVTIPRSHLRASYGDGFQGAPLRCQKRQEEGSFTRGSGECDEQAFSQESKDSGGAA